MIQAKPPVLNARWVTTKIIQAKLPARNARSANIRTKRVKLLVLHAPWERFKTLPLKLNALTVQQVNKLSPITSIYIPTYHYNNYYYPYH